MKLYATVASERATKGQGGNREILIDLFIENPDRKRMTMLKLTNFEERFELAIMRGGCDWEVIAKEEKGEKQKGDCNHASITSHDNVETCNKCGVTANMID